MVNDNIRTSGAMALVLILVTAGFMGTLMVLLPAMGAPGDDKLDPIRDEGMIKNLNFDRSSAYNTSEQKVNISWELPEMWAPDIVLTDLWVRIYNTMGGFNVYILWLNGTTYGGAIPDFVIWELFEGMTARTDYVINVTLVIYSNIDEKYYGDGDEWVFPIYDGTDMIREIAASPSTVRNDGTEWTNVSFRVMRTELDMGAPDLPFMSIVKYNLFSEATGEWVLPEGFGPLAPVPAGVNMLRGMEVSGGSLIYWFNWTIPLDQQVGPYSLALHVMDGWNYTEEENMTVLTVVLRELPPVMTNRSIYMHEDSFVNVNLNDHFSDPNGLPLVFWVNSSQFENISLAWMSTDKVNITSASDWSGTEGFTIRVNDSAGNNVSFDMTVNVMPVPDDLRAGSLTERTVLVQEDLGSADFDPTSFFYDPDGPNSIVVSLGWTWAKNETNATVKMPIWTWNDGNFSVSINSSTPTQGRAVMAADLESGSFTLPLTAWVGGMPILNSTMVVEVTPVNDVPRPVSDAIEMVRNQVLAQDLRELFYDPDGPLNGLNFTLDVTMTSANVTISYDNATFEITITPEINWTGMTTFKVNATDGVDHETYTMTLHVNLPTYRISGKVTYQDSAMHLVNVSADKKVATLRIGAQTVTTDNVTYSYMLVLSEGTYTVSITLNLPSEKLYNESANRSGYLVPAINDIVLTSDLTRDILVAWKDHIVQNIANWSDLDIENVQFKEVKSGWDVVVPVKDEDKIGYDELNITLIIRNKAGKDTDNNEFKMVWNSTSKEFSVSLDKESLENVSEGKLEYYFRDGMGHKSPVQKFEFKEKDEGAGIITVIVLIVLIILVLIALVFIMRKPSEEEAEEPEASEDEAPEPRSCPGCNESITDADAKECPYCGEGLSEE
ncbi:MAG: Ig-like domain-containing protein [Candidatus Thermoplasmatota archaeon]|jgi:hypothetical protein|nr:Ig-like domain-containing protein [Candidatus Thermoplasmatota archaeon]